MRFEVDRWVSSGPPVRRKMVSVIRLVKPDFIITLDPGLTYEAHPDHRTTAMAAVEAALYAPFPLAYRDDMKEGQKPHSVSGIAFAVSSHPNTVIDITETWEQDSRMLVPQVPVPGAGVEQRIRSHPNGQVG